MARYVSERSKRQSLDVKMKIIRYWFHSDMAFTQSEIARLCGVSRQYVHQIIKEGKGYTTARRCHKKKR